MISWAVILAILALTVVFVSGCGGGGDAAEERNGDAERGGPVGQADAAACASNRNIVSAAAQQYYYTEGAYPTSIQALVPVTCRAFRVSGRGHYRCGEPSTFPYTASRTGTREGAHPAPIRMEAVFGEARYLDLLEISLSVRTGGNQSSGRSRTRARLYPPRDRLCQGVDITADGALYLSQSSLFLQDAFLFTIGHGRFNIIYPKRSDPIS